MLSLLRRLLGRPQSWHAPGRDFARRWSAALPPGAEPAPPDPLTRWFEARDSGPGVWKWTHYLPAYHRHLQKFVGRAPVVLEIGVFSGGSLEMWPHYFGPGTRVVGTDIEPACKAYERPGVSVLVGDQSSPAFWREALASGKVPPPDIVIDDGSHLAEHQRATLECLLPVVRPGGVYAVEDVHGRGHSFAAFVQGLSDELNAGDGMASNPDDARKLTARPSAFQSAIHSVHLYPFLVVVEKRSEPLAELVAPRRGTRWEPFLG